jgi:LacI family transcriptional regulator
LPVATSTRTTRPRKGRGQTSGLKQIAADLNLAVSTVSHALKGDGTLSDDTRKRVREHAARVGYTANAHARRIRSTGTRVIGLVIPDVVLTYNEFVQHAFRHVAKSGRELQIVLSEFDSNLEDQALKTLLEQRVDGILLKSCFRHIDEVPSDHALRTVMASETPTVIVGDEVRTSGLPCCRTPTEVYGRLLVERLISEGRRCIDWLLAVDLNETPMDTLPQHRRAIQAAEQQGRQMLGDDFVIRLRTLDELPAPAGQPSPLADYGNYINEGLPERGLTIGRRMAAAAMDETHPPDALVCMNDVIAIGAMRELTARGVDIPKDVAVATYHATTAAPMAFKPLLVVTPGPGSFAAKALSMLDLAIDGRDPGNDHAEAHLTLVGGIH